MKIVIEGPDRCGKTTLAMAMATTEQSTFLHLPQGEIRAMVFKDNVKATAKTFLFFADTMSLWQDPIKDFVLDRDILSMLAYQGYLTGNMNPIIILNLYRSVIYKDNKPDKIIYLTNEPFEKYDEDDIFETHGYVAIRAAYEMAVKLFELNFPDILVERIDANDFN
jgi:thymidylate kinase